MNRMLLSLVIIVFLAIEAFPSVKHIVTNLKLFGAYKDTVTQPELDKYVKSKVDSLMDVELVERLDCFDSPPQKYTFAELPCVKIYFYECQLTFFRQGNYRAVLFNTCDSTIYPFGGGAPRFSKIICQYLPEIIEKDKLLELAYLYMNTVDVAKPYYILRDTDHYKAIWQKAIDNVFFSEKSDSLEKISKEDIAIIEKYMTRTHYRISEYKGREHYNIAFDSWNWLSGEIEHWNFLISKEVFQVESNFTEFIKMGPRRELQKEFLFGLHY